MRSLKNFSIHASKCDRFSVARATRQGRASAHLGTARRIVKNMGAAARVLYYRIYIYIYIYIYIHIYIYIYIYIHIYIHTHTHTRTHIYIHTYIYTYTHIYMYIKTRRGRIIGRHGKKQLVKKLCL